MKSIEELLGYLTRSIG